MAMTLSKPNGSLQGEKRRLAPTRLAGARGARVNWIQVIKLPALLLLSMTLWGLLIAGHTRYVETGTDRLITQADQLVANVSKAVPVDSATGHAR